MLQTILLIYLLTYSKPKLTDIS